MEHNCLDHIVLRTHESTERHGLDCGPYEHFTEEWHECRQCHAKYEPSEVDAMWAAEPQEAGNAEA